MFSKDVHTLLKRIDRLYRSDSSHALMEMHVLTKDWKRTMRMEIWTSGMERTLIQLLSPRKDKGIKTLKLDSQMWNYFPKINKVLKVPPSMMMSSWMGSDFTNDDLVRKNTFADDYSAELIMDPDNHENFYEIKMVPHENTVSVWGKITITIRKKDLIPILQVYFDEHGEEKRVMKFMEIREIDGRQIPTKIEMTTLNKKRQTLIKYLHIDFDPQIPDNLFSFSHLHRRK